LKDGRILFNPVECLCLCLLKRCQSSSTDLTRTNESSLAVGAGLASYGYAPGSTGYIAANDGSPGEYIFAFKGVGAAPIFVNHHHFDA